MFSRSPAPFPDFPVPSGQVVPAGEPAERLHLVLYSSQASCGFPSPADDHLESPLDVQSLLIRRPAATFFCRADGDSMVGAGIHDGDLLVVDRSIPPQPGDVVVATMGGGLTVKLLRQVGGRWHLAPANASYPAMAIDPEDGVQVWGVVTYAVTALCPR